MIDQYTPAKPEVHSAFEAEMLKMGVGESFLERSKLGDQGYQHPTVHERWLGWHACHAVNSNSN